MVTSHEDDDVLLGTFEVEQIDLGPDGASPGTTSERVGIDTAEGTQKAVIDQEVERLQGDIHSACERLVGRTRTLDDKRTRADFELRRAMIEEFERVVGPQRVRLDRLLAQRKTIA